MCVNNCEVSRGYIFHTKLSFFYTYVQISVCKFLGIVFGITYHQIICHEYNKFANTSTLYVVSTYFSRYFILHEP